MTDPDNLDLTEDDIQALADEAERGYDIQVRPKPSDIYIIGPMAGYMNLNREAFDYAAERLRSLNFTVLDPHTLKPHQHVGPCPMSYAINPDGHSAACYLRAAIPAMLRCKRVFVLEGWESSVGARTELFVATTVGMPVTFEHELEEPETRVDGLRGMRYPDAE